MLHRVNGEKGSIVVTTIRLFVLSTSTPFWERREPTINTTYVAFADILEL
jgi:hypothetical protein